MNKPRQLYGILHLLLMACLHCTLLTGEYVRPINGSTVHTINILFEWPQIQLAEQYRLQVCSDEEFENCLPIIENESLIRVIKNGIDWNTEYFWRVKPIFPNGSDGEWGIPRSFNTSSPIGNSHTVIIDESKIQAGITIFGAFFDYYTAAIDQFGNEIWNSGDDHFVYYNTMENGQIFGSMYRPDLENNLPGTHYSVNNEIHWQEPNDHFLHHEIIQLPDGNYMGIIEEHGYGPIPPDACLEYETTGECEYATFFQNLGYIVDGETVEFKWIGDRIIVWDKDNSNELWSWNTFDHFDMNDFDRIGGSWTDASNNLQRYDWTHCNALWFDDEESMIYLSSRHLSRITKIAYPSGEVIWNMGLEMPSGDVQFGTELGFSYQHSLQLTQDGHIVFLDNGNLSETLLETDYPTSRAMEIAVLDDTSAQLIWEYNLPDSLFGFASGNAQKLENGNYLVTTVGDGGTSIEVTEDHEIVWEGKYNLTLPSGAVYRAQRIPGLYAGEFSLRLPPSTNVDFYNTLIYSDENYNVDILLKNESDYPSTYQVSWFFEHIGFSSPLEFAVQLDPEETVNLSDEQYTLPFPLLTDSNIHKVTFTITPTNVDHLQRTYEFHWAEDESVAAPRTVFPGDTDNNGIVDEYDILPIGVYFHNYGFERDSISFNWNGNPALKWNSEAETFADANGDGTINAQDVIGIGVNWGNTHEVLGQNFLIDGTDLNLVNQHKNAYLELYHSLSGSDESVMAMKSLLENMLNIPQPTEISLIQNYPNPFNTETMIAIILPMESNITMSVFDLHGRHVTDILKNEYLPEGESIIQWNAAAHPSGIYFCKMETPQYQQTQKMILLK